MFKLNIESIAWQAGFESDENGLYWNSEYNEEGVDLESFAHYLLEKVSQIIAEQYQALPLETAVYLLDLDEAIKQQFYSTQV